jgi:hypothetical protein
MRITHEVIQSRSSQRIRHNESMEQFMGRLSHLRLEELSATKIEVKSCALLLF